jgi:hypothetical protein
VAIYLFVIASPPEAGVAISIFLKFSPKSEIATPEC